MPLQTGPSDLNYFGTGFVDYNIIRYQAHNVPSQLIYYDGAQAYESKIMDRAVYHGIIQNSIESGVGGVGFMEAANNPYDRMLLHVSKTDTEVHKIKAVQTGNQPLSGKNLLKCQEIFYLELFTVVEVTGQGKLPAGYTLDPGGGYIPSQIEVDPLSGNETFTVPANTYWVVAPESADDRDLFTWRIQYHIHVPNTSPFTQNVFTPGSQWNNLIAGVYPNAKVCYVRNITAMATDWWAEGLQVIEYRTDSDGGPN